MKSQETLRNAGKAEYIKGRERSTTQVQAMEKDIGLKRICDKDIQEGMRKS